MSKKLFFYILFSPTLTFCIYCTFRLLFNETELNSIREILLLKELQQQHSEEKTDNAGVLVYTTSIKCTATPDSSTLDIVHAFVEGVSILYSQCYNDRNEAKEEEDEYVLALSLEKKRRKETEAQLDDGK